ncbi:hypothetical protein JDV09_13430 [Mycobacterium sp. Y57]|uniref:hypothetical protein n=1 Tax=Mycolicibacterium xanthum TaxID=2796469 RepID=UPI001C844C13|nr:hypothetical protein [Mycolicibacterium xanthum]MBX7433103.1 hypothetical protein [Mycolicibacterium xanthum]
MIVDTQARHDDGVAAVGNWVDRLLWRGELHRVGNYAAVRNRFTGEFMLVRPL